MIADRIVDPAAVASTFLATAINEPLRHHAALAPAVFRSCIARVTARSRSFGSAGRRGSPSGCSECAPAGGCRFDEVLRMEREHPLVIDVGALDHGDALAASWIPRFSPKPPPPQTPVGKLSCGYASSSHDLSSCSIASSDWLRKMHNSLYGLSRLIAKPLVSGVNPVAAIGFYPNRPVRSEGEWDWLTAKFFLRVLATPKKGG